MNGDKNIDEKGDFTLYTVGYPYDAKYDEIKALFEKYGKLNSVTLHEKNGSFCGVAFVKFETRAMAEEAIKGVDNYNFNGRRISVRFVDKKYPRDQRDFYQRRYDDFDRYRDYRRYDDYNYPPLPPRRYGDFPPYPREYSPMRYEDPPYPLYYKPPMRYPAEFRRREDSPQYARYADPARHYEEQAPRYEVPRDQIHVRYQEPLRYPEPESRNPPPSYSEHPKIRAVQSEPAYTDERAVKYPEMQRSAIPRASSDYGAARMDYPDQRNIQEAPDYARRYPMDPRRV